MSDQTTTAAIQNISLAINTLTQTIGQVFPGATTVSTSNLTTIVSSNVIGTISVISSSGASYRMALFAP